MKKLMNWFITDPMYKQRECISRIKSMGLMNQLFEAIRCEKNGVEQTGIVRVKRI
jgi:hypothetical protein